MVNSFITYLKENKPRARLMLLLLLAIALLLVASPLFAEEEAEVNEDGLAEYKAELEAELSRLCSSVEGAGECRVTVTFEGGAESVYKGSHLVETKPPRVMGIAVVCTGAGSDAVRADLTQMLSALFELGSNRISVLKLNY